MQSSASRSPRRWLFGLLVLLVIAGLCWKFWPGSAAPKEGAGQKAVAGHTGRSGGMRPGFGGATGPVPVRVAPAVKGDFPLYYKAL
ncbi:multidrug transporter subunit MdtA, partial [Pseudomonas aeruginosa]|nr:multidrug transporter subunit MdtA [Pseudomonas aeruginosa]